MEQVEKSCKIWKKVNESKYNKNPFKWLKELAKYENLEYVVKNIEQVIPLDKKEWQQYFYYAKKFCFKVSFFICVSNEYRYLIFIGMYRTLPDKNAVSKLQ